MLPPLPTATPTASNGPAASPSATDPGPGIGINAEGASGFARAWFTALTLVAKTGRTQPFRALSEPGCVSCRRFAGSIDTIWATGQIRGGAFVVRGAATPELTDNAKATVSVQYYVTASEQVARDGTIRKRTPRVSSTSADLTLARRGSQWRAAELVVQR